LANIAEATFLLRFLHPCPETAEALKLTQRAFVLLDDTITPKNCTCYKNLHLHAEIIRIKVSEEK
jgi:hypothetical protein